MQKMKEYLAKNAAGLALSLPVVNDDMDVSDRSLAECADVMEGVNFDGMKFRLTPNFCPSPSEWDENSPPLLNGSLPSNGHMVSNNKVTASPSGTTQEIPYGAA